MTFPAIELDNVSFNYDRNEALKHVSFALKEHGFYIFLGPNGGGKTTLVKLIMGIISPKSGSLNVHGGHPKIRRNHFGYIPQKLHFDPMFPLSLFDFVRQGLLSELPWHGIWPMHTFEQTKAILKKFNLEELHSRSIGELSGGQLQRAIIARALVSDPDILILDEPLSGLDHASAKNIIRLIDEMKGKKTIILITHVITHLLKKADTVFMVEKTVFPIKHDAICKHMELGLFHSEEEGCDHE